MKVTKICSLLFLYFTLPLRNAQARQLKFQELNTSSPLTTFGDAALYSREMAKRETQNVQTDNIAQTDNIEPALRSTKDAGFAKFDTSSPPNLQPTPLLTSSVPSTSTSSSSAFQSTSSIHGSTSSTAGSTPSVASSTPSISSSTLGAPLSISSSPQSTFSPAEGPPTMELPLSSTRAPNFPVGDRPVTTNQQGDNVIGTQSPIPVGTSITDGAILYSPSPSGAALQPGASAFPLLTHALEITVGGHTITADAGGDYIVGSQTLIPGGSSVAISGTVYSLLPSGTALQVGFTTVPFTNSPEPAATLGRQIATANSNGAFIFSSQTLAPGGPAITVSGTVVSLGNDGRTMVVGGKTEVLVSTTSRGIGEPIWSGVDGGPTSGASGVQSGGNLTNGQGRSATTTADPVPFTGGGKARKGGSALGLWVVEAFVVLVSVMFA